MIHIIGGGLAGCEAAWQAARRGERVTLHEMRPRRPTPVHRTDRLAELVCSNSFRGDKLDNAVGLLKEEMRRLGSLVLEAAGRTRVPAGAALAVDREQFANAVTTAIASEPAITVLREEVERIPPPRPATAVLVATGPLTSASLTADIAQFVGSEHLYFYDAISPIVLAESIDWSKVYRASRWGRSLGGGEPRGADEGDYVNCPLGAPQYARFLDALMAAERAPLHALDESRFFEGCLPIEVMASRGRETLRFGPMKPVGLVDPRTGRLPHAVVQLRQDNLAGDHYSLVGFQTQLRWGAQADVFRLIPGLEAAEFVRFGMIHRNTYVNAPTVIHETWQTRRRPDLFLAGQMSGVEGYVESAASGLLAGINASRWLRDEPLTAPPRTTALGALAYYVSHADPRGYQPTNIAFGLMPPLERPARRKADRKRATAARALAALDAWRLSAGLLASDERVPTALP